MPTRAKLRQMQLSREDYEGIIGEHSEEETKEERDDTEDEDEEEIDFGGLEEQDIDSYVQQYLREGDEVPTGQRMRNLYKASDHCKRHRLPDDEEHTVEVETHKRRKPKKTA